MRAGRGKLSGRCENLQGTILFFLKFSTISYYWLVYVVCYVLLFLLVGVFLIIIPLPASQFPSGSNLLTRLRTFS